MSPALTRLSFNRPAKLGLLGVTLISAGLAFVWIKFDPHTSPLPEMAVVSLGGDSGSQVFVQVQETTIYEWNQCYLDGGCTLELRPPIGGNPKEFPATGINWLDAQDYVRWLSKESRHPFRLPTSVEWFEFARNVVPETPDPIFTDSSLAWASAYQIEESIDRTLKSSGAWSTSIDGIVDLDGNVWEWTQDCYDGNTNTSRETACAAYVLGGEHRAVVSLLVRDSARGGCAVGTPPAHLGLRPVTDRDPQSLVFFS